MYEKSLYLLCFKKWCLSLLLFFATNFLYAAPATKLKITTTPFSTTQNNPSPALIIEAQDDTGTKDTSFNNTVSLLAGSVNGKFSLDRINWIDTTTIILSSGTRTLYYKDGNAGTPVITASRDGLSPDTQTEAILAQSVNETASYITFTPYQIFADGTSVCSVAITINDTYGFPIPDKLATLQTTNGNSDTINDSVGGIANPQTTDVNGQCTFTIKSTRIGIDTITATCEGNTIARGVNKYRTVGIWNFDRDLKDFSGYGNNGTSGSPIFVTVPDSAVAGSALRFDGTSTRTVRVLDSSSSRLGKSDFTFEFWIKRTDSNEKRVIEKGNWPVTWLDIDIYSAGNVEMEMGDENGKVGTTSSSGTIALNVWNHVVITVDRTNFKTKYYLNGNLDSTKDISSSFTGNLDVPGKDIYIGSYIYNNFIGLLDEFKIYNRALSETEVNNAYNKNCVIKFVQTATKLAFTTSEKTINAGGAISDTIQIEMQNASSQICSDFNDFVTVKSSSLTGKFSPNGTIWSDANNYSLNLSGGAGKFYYKDSTEGVYVITVERSGVQSATQTITVTSPAVSETVSYLRTYSPSSGLFSADGTSPCTVVIFIGDNYNNAIWGQQVTLSTSRGSSYDTITYPYGQITNDQGICTAVIKSSYAGVDTITANCAGTIIAENIIKNPSFELDKTNWNCAGNTWTIVTDIKYSGNKSLRYTQVSGDRYAEQDMYISSKTPYKFTQYVKNDTLSASVNSIRLVWWATPSKTWPADYLGESSGGGIGTAPSEWRILSATITSKDTAVYMTYRCNVSTVTGTVWFDCVRMQRIPTVNWTASKLKITTPSFNILENQSSSQITVRAQGDADASDTDSSFNNTVTLSSSSSGGRFSLDGVLWSSSNDSAITVLNGYARFYYKDATPGTPTLTVSRAGLQSAVQIETITAKLMNETASYITFTPYRIPADNASSCSVVVTINDSQGLPIANRTVVLVTARGIQDTIKDSAGGSANTQTTDINGQCTWTILSSYTGLDTITAICEGKTMSGGVNKQDAVGIWHFDQDYKDVSASGNNSFCSSPVWVSAPDSAAQGSALQFNGTSQRVITVYDGPGIQFGTSDFTIDCWVKLSVLDKRLMDKNAWPNTWWNIDIFADGRVEMEMTDENTKSGFTTSNGSISANAWTHLAIVVDRKNFTTSYYFNGNLDCTKTFSSSCTGSLSIAGKNLTIGAGYNLFIGLMDELKIYKRALSSVEISSSYSRKANICWTATKLALTSPPRTVTAGAVSDSLTVEAQDGFGTKDSYDNDSIALTSSSLTGRFSSNGVNWSSTNETYTTLSSGTGLFYYKDTVSGIPTITVSRAGLLSNTQQITVQTGSFSNTVSTLNVSAVSVVADGVMPCTVTITTLNYYGAPLTGKQVTIYTFRGPSYDTITQPSAVADTNGICTGTIVSSQTGQDTVLAVCDGETFNNRIGITWTGLPAKIAIITPPRSFSAGFVSDSISVEIRDAQDSKVNSFNDTVTLSSSSSAGAFFLNTSSLSSTSVIILSSGTGTFYYRDGVSGSPVITVSRQDLASATQTFTVSATVVSETTSYLRTHYSLRGQIPADGITPCTVTIFIADENNNGLWGQPVTVYTSRGSVYDTITYPGGQFTDASGFCTAIIKSSYVGQDTFTAVCAGINITENIVKNASFEKNLVDWSAGGFTIDTNVKYSGNKSLRCSISDTNMHLAYAMWPEASQGLGYPYGFMCPVSPITAYKFTQYAKTDALGGSGAKINVVFFQDSTYMGEGNYSTITGTTDWTFQSVILTLSSNVNYVMDRCYVGATTSGTAWFDCVRMQRIPTINWTATKLIITSPPRTVTAGAVSESITVDASGEAGGADISFNNTITLRSSSSTGRFSLNGISWSSTNDSSITLVAGTGYFYYRDTVSGSPTITVSRQGLTSDVQQFNVQAGSFSNTMSQMSVNATSIVADGLTFCTVTITINNHYGGALSGKQVTIYTFRGPSYDTITQPSSLTDTNGQCTGAIVSSQTGDDTIVAVCDGDTLSNVLAIKWTGIATKLAFITPPRTVKEGSVSDSIAVEVRDSENNRVGSFNETVSLSTSSSTGKFSVSATPWTDVTILTLSSGSGTFYYKDTAPGSYTITVSRQGFSSDTQSISVSPVYPLETVSYLKLSSSSVRADGTSICTVTVTIKDDSMNPLSGKNVVVQSSRGVSYDTITQPSLTDSNGQCTGYIISPYAGYDTITATCSSRTINRCVEKYNAGGIWHFDMDAKDYSGYGANGTVSSPLWAYGSSDSAVMGASLRLDGTSARTVTISNTSSFQFGTSDFTFEFWVKPESVTGTERRIMGISGYPQDYWVIDITSNGNLQLEMKDTTGAGFSTNSDGSLTAGVWNHVAIITNRASFKVYYYFNGTLNSTKDLPGSFTGAVNGSGSVGIGYSYMQLYGLVDEVKIYKRALNSSEIKSSYQLTPDPANINWTAGKFAFNTAPHRFRSGSYSETMTISARGIAGGTDSTFNDTALLSTSSNTGSFSVAQGDWQDINVITLSNGQASFYYRDYAVGKPTVTVSRDDLGLISATQNETVTSASLVITSPGLSISPGESGSVTVEARKLDGGVDTAYNDTVSLITTSAKGKFSISNTTWVDTTVVKLLSGYATFYYRDKRAGSPTITIGDLGIGLYDNQQENIVQPVITLTKTMLNERTGISGNLVPVTSNDTVIFTLTVSNAGNNTATSIIITDTQAFDTNIYSTLVFVSMDTNTIAETWAYTDVASYPAWITGAPTKYQENVKGLRWKLTTLGPTDSKSINFRVRIK